MKTYLEVQKKQDEYKNKLIKLRNEENPDKKLLSTYSQRIISEEHTSELQTLPRIA